MVVTFYMCIVDAYSKHYLVVIATTHYSAYADNIIYTGDFLGRFGRTSRNRGRTCTRKSTRTILESDETREIKAKELRAK